MNEARSTVYTNRSTTYACRTMRMTEMGVRGGKAALSTTCRRTTPETSMSSELSSGRVYGCREYVRSSTVPTVRHTSRALYTGCVTSHSAHSTSTFCTFRTDAKPWLGTHRAKPKHRLSSRRLIRTARATAAALATLASAASLIAASTWALDTALACDSVSCKRYPAVITARVTLAWCSLSSKLAACQRRSGSRARGNTNACRMKEAKAKGSKSPSSASAARDAAMTWWPPATGSLGPATCSDAASAAPHARRYTDHVRRPKPQQVKCCVVGLLDAARPVRRRQGDSRPAANDTNSATQASRATATTSVVMVTCAYAAWPRSQETVLREEAGSDPVNVAVTAKTRERNFPESSGVGSGEYRGPSSTHTVEFA